MKKRQKYFLSILLLLLSILTFDGYSQITKIMGVVTDSITKEPIPFVNLILKGTSIGATTNFDGEYSIESNSRADTLLISYMGYNSKSYTVKLFKFQTINFELSPSSQTLSEVVIVPGENPAIILLRKVIANKDKYNRENYDGYTYEAYNKIQLDANNITDKFRKRRVFKQFQFVFDHIDTSTVNGKAYLPLFLTETLSDFYYKKNPKGTREVIKASKVSGVENESFSTYLGDMYQNVNVYDNFIMLFEKNFVSPIANNATLFYKYYLVDSAFFGNKWCYKIMFKPRRKQELTFTGDIWIHDSTYAVKKLNVRIADDANINFINDLMAIQEFDLVDETHWMIVKDLVVIDFNVLEESKTATGFYGHKTTTYKNFKFDGVSDNDVFSSQIHVIVEDSSFKKSDDFWVTARHDTLTQDEKVIYEMVDSIKNMPVFKTYIDVIQMIVTGYYVRGNFEIGPYASMFSFNQLEGNRFRLGGRTSNDFSTKIMYNAHLAYGTKDEKFKYGGGLIYMKSKNPRRTFNFQYKNDIEQLGQSQNAFREDYIIGSILRRNPLDKLSMVEEFSANYEHEWFTGFSNTLNLIHRDIFPVGKSEFKFEQNGNILNSITTSEVRLDVHFAYKEKYMMGEFERVSLGTIYPILDIQYSHGFNNIWESNYSYDKIQMNLTHWFNVRSFGWSKYIIETGRVFGELPYPLLKLHEGNETYSFDEQSFNTMNYYEFVSDKYVSLYYTHHFDGFFLNHMPLMRKLKWREVVFGKGVVGDLGDENKKYSTFPTSLNELNKPFFEAGVGIENILKIIRIDAIWRLSHLNNPDINKFSIMGTLKFSL
ncbi:MAG: DUF5686 and carboxypeptidase regulatory-like domain-containing protein [Saprospiraceae bacterium]|nr:DUF5686 and carboxypeptidase regulatory-like domain-containing protein [Saprospiraceae bacterium]